MTMTKEYAHQYYEKNKAKILAESKKRREANKERYAEYRRKSHAKHKAERIERSRKWFADHPDYKRNHRLKVRYGITIDIYNRMLTEQNGCCAICGSNDPCDKSGYFSVDHDHITNKTRRLLCRHCNIGLGNFKDDIHILQKAIDYLSKS